MRIENADRAQSVAILLNGVIDLMPDQSEDTVITDDDIKSVSRGEFLREFGYVAHVDNDGGYFPESDEQRINTILEISPDVETTEEFEKIKARKEKEITKHCENTTMTREENEEIEEIENELIWIADGLEGGYINKITETLETWVEELKMESEPLLEKIFNEVVDTVCELTEKNFDVTDINVSLGYGFLINKEGDRINHKDEKFDQDKFQSATRLSTPSFYVLADHGDNEAIEIRISDHKQVSGGGYIESSYWDEDPNSGHRAGNSDASIIVSPENIDRTQFNNFLNSLEKENVNQAIGR